MGKSSVSIARCEDPHDFGKVEDEWAGRDPFDEEVLAFVHGVLAPAQDIELDKQGRLRIPANLRELAAIDREVEINSVLDRIEIWSRAAWEKRFPEAVSAAANLGRRTVA